MPLVYGKLSDSTPQLGRQIGVSLERHGFMPIVSARWKYRLIGIAEMGVLEGRS
jgi:hypothetical protein